MTVTQKRLDISDTELTAQQYAEQNNLWMNMLGGVYYDKITNKYKMAPIKYSDVSLLGEKIRFASGQEFQVIHSCLASEYKNKKEVYNAWWDRAKKLVEQYKEQQKIAEHIASNNTDIKKLRKEGALLGTEDLTDGM